MQPMSAQTTDAATLILRLILCHFIVGEGPQQHNASKAVTGWLAYTSMKVPRSFAMLHVLEYLLPQAQYHTHLQDQHWALERP